MIQINKPNMFTFTYDHKGDPVIWISVKNKFGHKLIGGMRNIKKK